MRAIPRLRVHRVPAAALLPLEVDRLWQLYAASYDHVDRRTFDHDIAEKTLVFIGTDAETGATVGFSTALFYVHRYGRRRIGIYFSGDTIIQPKYWGQHALHRAVLGELLRWKLRHPLTPLYWHLICSGYRTYLTLVRNFPVHWPHHRRPTPAWELGLLDSIGRARYGGAWQPDLGVVSPGAPKPVLKAAVAPITPDLLALPEIALFVRANPGYSNGDELAMIARLDAAAVTGMVGKWLRKALRGRRARHPGTLATAGPGRWA